MESNWIEGIWNWFYRIFQIIFHLQINRIPNFWIESNEFRKILLHSIVGVQSNKFGIIFHQIFWIYCALSNQSNRKFSNWNERISNEVQFDSTPITLFGFWLILEWMDLAQFYLPKRRPRWNQTLNSHQLMNHSDACSYEMCFVLN